MAWSRLINQQRVRSALTRAVESDRIAHAYLFHGPDGSGKRAAALAFAQTLQCTDRSGPEACGACLACDKVARLIHPDVHVLMPHPNDATSEEINARTALLAESPYEIVDFRRRASLDGAGGGSNKQVAYLVDRVYEDIRRPMSYRPAEGAYRIAILLDADLMRTEAANAFLKMLEEPGAQTVFMLLTSRLDHMLPTILSRCQQLRFEPLTVTDIEQALVAEDLADAGMAAVLARMADGSYSQARTMAVSDDLRGSREEVLNFLRQSYKGDGHVVMQLIDAMASTGREPLKFLLQVLLGLMRDLLLLSAAGEDADIVNVDQRDVLRKFSAGLPDARLDVMIDSVERCILLVERNTNARLVLTVLSMSLGRAMRGDKSALVPLSLTP